MWLYNNCNIHCDLRLDLLSDEQYLKAAESYRSNNVNVKMSSKSEKYCSQGEYNSHIFRVIQDLEEWENQFIIRNLLVSSYT